MRVALLLVQLDRLLEQPARRVRITSARGHLAGAVEQRRLLRPILRQLRCLFEVASRFRGRGERGGALPGPRQHRTRLLLDLGCICRVRACLVGGQVMGGDHLDHLVLVGGEGSAQVGGGCEMPGATLSLRERLVGDMSDKVLEEPVLAVLGRAGICLDAQHLLPFVGDVLAERAQHDPGTRPFQRRRDLVEDFYQFCGHAQRNRDRSCFFGHRDLLFAAM